MKRSISIAEHKTSISLEDPFWSSLRHIAGIKRMPLRELVALIDSQRQGNLSSAIRLFVLSYYREIANSSFPTQSLDATISNEKMAEPAYRVATNTQIDQPPIP